MGRVIEFPTRDRALEALQRTGYNATQAALTMGLNPRTFRDYVNRENLRPEGVKAAPAGLTDDLSSEPSFMEEVPVFTCDYSDRAEHFVYPLGDVHLGSKMHDAERWADWVGYLRANPETTSLLGTGDFFNAGIIGSKSDVYDERFTVGEAKRKLRDDLNGVTVDCLARGNHEDRIVRAVGDCPVEDVCDWHGIPYVGTSALLVYLVGDVEYEFFVRHGTGNGQNLGQLPKGAMVAHADVYVTGHTHKQAATADEVFVREGNRMVRRRRYYVSSGSFLAYEGYAAARGYVPTRLGAPRIHLDGRRKDVHVSI